MISKNDISNFFNDEAEAAKKSWEETINLPIKDRIRKRKAIQSVYLDRDYREKTEENYILLKLKVDVNLSDFKEGECLILHKENTTSGFECDLYSFEGDNSIIIQVFPQKFPSDIESYYDIPLVLDKALVDLRTYVYYPFLACLPGSNDVFWKSMILNTRPKPSLEEKEKNAEEIDDTAMNYGFDLLPSQREAIINCMSAKDYYLIQGPPGTGKSFVLAFIIIEEMYYLHHKVIVIGPNHMAINNTLEQCLKSFPACSSAMIKTGQKYNAPTKKVIDEDKEYHIENFHHLNPSFFNNLEDSWLVGLTPHSLYSSRAAGLKCDTLIIDEAGQMTIPLAMMGMIKAKKVILAGDHKQLPPIISSEEIPDYMRKSAFETLMTEGNYTLLDTSFRMCEPLCEYVSDLFYDSKVKAKKQGCGDMVKCDDPLYSFDKPVIIHQVDDDGCQASDKEAEYIVNTIVGFLKKGVPAIEIAVLAPFRAQTATIRRGIRKREDISDEDKSILVADTVDKMQGQEREVIMYSFTAGDPDYISEMADFLYKPNKLNVAFSRAKSKLIIVGNFDKILENAGDGFPHIKGMLNHKNVTKV